MVNSPREQGENKSGKSRPTSKVLWKRKKSKSIVPVSYLFEAIQLQKEEGKKKKVEIDNDNWIQSLNAIKMMITWKENVNRYTQKFSKKRIGLQLCLFCFEN